MIVRERERERERKRERERGRERERERERRASTIAAPRRSSAPRFMDLYFHPLSGSINFGAMHTERCVHNAQIFNLKIVRQPSEAYIYIIYIYMYIYICMYIYYIYIYIYIIWKSSLACCHGTLTDRAGGWTLQRLML